MISVRGTFFFHTFKIKPDNDLSGRYYRFLCEYTPYSILHILYTLYSIPGVAKLLDSPSHFSKFEIFRNLQLNTYLKGMKKKVLRKLQKLYLLKTYT